MHTNLVIDRLSAHMAATHEATFNHILRHVSSQELFLLTVEVT
jgi:hemin uptake protein HemP